MRLWLDVKTLRKRHGWLQGETAEKLGVSRGYLSVLENRKRGISISMMDTLIRVFGVKYEDFSPLPRQNETVARPAPPRSRYVAATQREHTCE